MTGQNSHHLSSAAWGAVAGLVAGLPLGALMLLQGMLVDPGGVARVLVYAALTGAAIGMVITQRSHGLAEAASGGALLGLLGWMLFSLTVDPVLHGTAPTWSVDAATTAYRSLVGDVLQGSLAGAALFWFRSHRTLAHVPAAPRPARVVIVGGGFGGVAAAQRFERLALRRIPVDVTVISNSNFLLFTPMLAEVASSALEPAHISTPVRTAAAHTRFRHGAVADVDTETRAVRVDDEWVPYDHLVLAVGSVPHFLALPGVEDNALTMKDLGDATRLREHVIELLERTDHLEPDPEERRRLLTFVVAGGGFAGTETIAELFDLVYGVLHLYPGIGPDEPRFVLVHSRDRILPELSAALGDYAQARLGGWCLSRGGHPVRRPGAGGSVGDAGAC